MTASGEQFTVSSKRPGKTRWSELLICLLLTAFLLTEAKAQQRAKVPRIAYLSLTSPSSSLYRTDALRQGLRELGYVEGKNIVIDYRYAESKIDRVPALAVEIVRLKVDVIVTGGGSQTRAAKAATSTIPIVMTNDPDPVGNGHISSLARPGGNITGLSTLAPELNGKRLEILKEVIPKLSRVAILGTSTVPGNAPGLRETELAAKALGVQLQYLDVLSSKDLEPAFRAASNGQADALLVFASGILTSQQAQIIKLAARDRLPGIYIRQEFVAAGGLMFYGVNGLEFGPARRHVCRQDSERRQPRGASR